jgi:hypothetical protein
MGIGSGEKAKMFSLIDHLQKTHLVVLFGGTSAAQNLQGTVSFFLLEGTTCLRRHLGHTLVRRRIFSIINEARNGFILFLLLAPASHGWAVFQ